MKNDIESIYTAMQQSRSDFNGTTSLRPVVLITGAGGGIGSALVQAFEVAGWDVVSSDRQPLERTLHVTADIGACADPESDVALTTFAALRMATGGRLKALIANAAHQVVKPSGELNHDDWQTTLNVNLLAPFWLAMAFRDELARNCGSVLAISSIHEKLTKPGFVAYATSKAALSGMMRAMAVDLGDQIRCNAICPAAISTPMLKAGFDAQPDAYRQLQAHHPAGRIGTPQEVAATAVFICSDQAGFMNGSCVDLAGGIHARLHDPV
jgi:NAD(P)-dependent dehydrogenase (short-subunit alcohol dehydrogenase family)